ncbi:MAG: hypothetical protein IPL23_24445 [Saprospiraceae bacterium]|nr:hypothetical protein [Saprospiraceae bacterium]
MQYQIPAKMWGREIAGKYEEAISFGGVQHVQPFIIMPGLVESGKKIFKRYFLKE